MVPSDLFYLGGVQLWFGLSNGCLGSEYMIGAGEWIAKREMEAAGAFSLWPRNEQWQSRFSPHSPFLVRTEDSIAPTNSRSTSDSR